MRAFHLLLCSFLLTTPFLVACGGSSEPAASSGAPAAGTGGGAEVALETDQQKILYTLGTTLGEGLPQLGLSEEDLVYVAAGLHDRALDKELRADPGVFGPQLQGFAQERLAAAAASETERAREFLTAQAAEPGAEELESGLIMTELEAGDGTSPEAGSLVTVHYHGTLRDGTVFDSSYDRGNPVTINLGQVIPCWSEALQRMKVGGKSRLVCPPDLAYGAQGRPPKILPGAALVFEVELLDIQDSGA